MKRGHFVILGLILVVLFIAGCQGGSFRPYCNPGDEICSSNGVTILNCGNDKEWDTIQNCADTGEVCDNSGGTPICVISQCSDGIDNDGDLLVDLNDPGCDDANDNNEVDDGVHVFGDIALLVSNPIALSDRENKIEILLNNLGVAPVNLVTYGSDLDDYELVVAVDNEALADIPLEDVEAFIDEGHNVLLLYDAIGAVYASRVSNGERLIVKSSEGFLETYESMGNVDDFRIVTTTGGYESHELTSVPANWNLIGKGGATAEGYGTSFYRESINGGRGALFGYDPALFTEYGEIVFDRIIRWVTDTPYVTKTIPQDEIALIIKGTIPTLGEQSIINYVSCQYYFCDPFNWIMKNVNVVNFHDKSRLITDYSRAATVIVIEDEIFVVDNSENNFYNQLINSGVNVLLLSNAGAALEGVTYRTTPVNRRLVVEIPEAFLIGRSGEEYPDVSTIAAYKMNSIPPNWNKIGYAYSSSDNQGTAFYREDIVSGSKGAIFTYIVPEQLSTSGVNHLLFDDVLRYVEAIYMNF